MKILHSFTSAIGLLLVLYSLMLLMFPPKFRSFWYGVNTRLTQKNEFNWRLGQKMFAYAGLVIGVIFILFYLVDIEKNTRPFTILILLICLWSLSKYVVHKILERASGE